MKMKIELERCRYQSVLASMNPLRNNKFWSKDDVIKYAKAIASENNPYGFEQEALYWKLAIDTLDYNWGVDACIRFKEHDVASGYMLLPSLYMSMREVYDKILFELKEEE